MDKGYTFLGGEGGGTKVDFTKFFTIVLSCFVFFFVFGASH